MDEGILELADGRILGYARWGSPAAPPVIYCHGFPGSRRELRLAEPVLRRHGVAAHIVALNRPGYGPSTFRRRTGFVDWPADVAEAADRLGLDRFAVLGASGGCPYALACGQRLGERVTRIGIVVGTTPLDAPGMADAPGVADLPPHWLAGRVEYGLAGWALRHGRETRVVARAAAGRRLGEADRTFLAQPAVRAWLLEVLRDVLAQGGRAAAHDAGLYRRPWGFSLAAATTEAWLWYAGNDEAVPAASGRWLAGRLPHARFELWPRHGHFTWAADDVVAEAVRTMTGEAG